jgi:hypothetical protein
VSTHAENPEHRSEALLLLTAVYKAQAESMNTDETRAAAKSAFDAGEEVFRRPLEPEIDVDPIMPQGITVKQKSC